MYKIYLYTNKKGNSMGWEIKHIFTVATYKEANQLYKENKNLITWIKSNV